MHLVTLMQILPNSPCSEVSKLKNTDLWPSILDMWIRCLKQLRGTTALLHEFARVLARFLYIWTGVLRNTTVSLAGQYHQQDKHQILLMARRRRTEKEEQSASHSRPTFQFYCSQVVQTRFINMSNRWGEKHNNTHNSSWTGSIEVDDYFKMLVLNLYKGIWKRLIYYILKGTQSRALLSLMRTKRMAACGLVSNVVSCIGNSRVGHFIWIKLGSKRSSGQAKSMSETSHLCGEGAVMHDTLAWTETGKTMAMNPKKETTPGS